MGVSMTTGKPGRPPLHGQRMATHHVKLDLATVARLREIGGGNMSKGIRLAVSVGVSPGLGGVGQAPLASPAATGTANTPGNDT